MTVIAWLLIVSLLLIFTLMVMASTTDGREKSPVWVRSGLVAGAALFLASGALLLSDLRGGEGTAAGVRVAQAQLMARPAIHDPWEGMGAPIPAEGRRFYVAAGCHQCHTIGAGTLVGPDLLEGVCKYDEAFLVRWILDTDSIYTELGMEAVNPGFPRMPAAGVGPDEALLIARYLESFPQPAG
ncbi:MAG: c-type cytochrome [Thermoanaerobaculia bacterium]